MNNGANVRDTKALELLGASLSNFKDVNGAVTATLIPYFEGQKAQLKQYEQKFEREMFAAEDAKKEADTAWRTALNSKNYSDKSSEWNADAHNAAKLYEVAENVHRKAVARFQTCKQIVKRTEMQLERTIQDCQKHLFRANDVADVSIDALQQILSGIDDYTSIKIMYANSASVPQSEITTNETPQTPPSVSNAPYKLKGQRAFIFNQVSDLDSTYLKDIEQELLDKNCHEVTVWADTVDEKNFLIANGYKYFQTQSIDNELSKNLRNNDGIEESTLLRESSEVNNYSKGETYFADGIDSKKIFFFDIDKFEANDSFWKQTASYESEQRYCELVQKYRTCMDALKTGKTLDQIRSQDSWVANAYDVFKKDAVNLLKVGGNYYMASNGRHRITAAQLMNMPIGAIVTEYHPK
jgi:hypothetical protein